jgi:hypothetical protein
VEVHLGFPVEDFHDPPAEVTACFPQAGSRPVRN